MLLAGLPALGCRCSVLGTVTGVTEYLPLAALVASHVVLAACSAALERSRQDGFGEASRTARASLIRGVSPTTRASLDLVRPPAKPEVRAWRARGDAVDEPSPRSSSDACVEDN